MSAFRLISRAASIGVSVNDTISETPTANDAVKPKLDMNLPDNALHKADRHEHRHQRKRRGHDRRADLARRFDRRLEGFIPFSSTNRKIFSSTTMASSITIPTIKVSESIVIELSV